MQIDAGRTFAEMVMNDPLPKGEIQQAVIDFLVGREDASIFGAMAVNAYVDERRMTEVIDLVSTCAAELAEELRGYLNERFHIAVRIRSVREGIGFRLYQVAKPKNRHLVDLRPVDSLPPSQRMEGVLVVSPAELIAGKVISYCSRQGKPKAGTDWRDLAHMLLTFPELKTESGEVQERLYAKQASEMALEFWAEFVMQEISAEDEDDEFG